MSTATIPRTEFKLTESDFKLIVGMIYDQAGIVLGDKKRDLIHSRLGRRLRELKLIDFKDYCKRLEGPDGADEMTVMINALTTNLTSFYREAHHFEHLKNVALPEFQAVAGKNSRRLRVWSSACSTGEEPYSIAMTLLEGGIDRNSWDVRILATDLNTEVLAVGSAGSYSAETFAKLPVELRQRFVDKQPQADGLKIKQNVRDMIAFRQLNLLGKWPMHGPFDVIFCRNVLIYFDNETKSKLIDRFVKMLRPGGWLYLGHSESLNGGHQGLALTDRTTYRREM